MLPSNGALYPGHIAAQKERRANGTHIAAAWGRVGDRAAAFGCYSRGAHKKTRVKGSP